MRVYYLTNANFALSNVALRRLKIARFSDLNDPFEMLAVDLADRDYRAAFKKMKDELSLDNGLICFSKSWTNPLLWGHYADKHTGICLGFDIKDERLSTVYYSKTPMRIGVDSKSGQPIITDEMINRLMRTKFSDWKYEDEMRVFISLDHRTRESGLYFKEFDTDMVLREIILGPRCELPISGVRAMVQSFTPEVTVIKSRIAFSSFRVIKSKSGSKVSA